MMDLDRIGARLSPWMAPATILTALIVGRTMGVGPAFLVLAGGTLLCVVLLLWSSLGRLTGESPLTLEEAVGMAAPSPEEERKRSILRALKDLEYERSVGKISEEDYAELGARYRADAKALLRKIEEQSAPARQKAEARLAARLKKENLSGDSAKKKRDRNRDAAPREPAPAVTESETVTAVAESEAVAAVATNDREEPLATPKCPACSTPNDADARFCKRCGAPLAVEEDTAP
jgi:hypothetical protein